MFVVQPVKCIYFTKSEKQTNQCLKKYFLAKTVNGAIYFHYRSIFSPVIKNNSK
jgi:hypothetical protein